MTVKIRPRMQAMGSMAGRECWVWWFIRVGDFCIVRAAMINGCEVCFLLYGIAECAM